ncbi:MAG: hypothetical protein JXQ82_10195 [Methanomicrobiaceae archaeon]|nr:hypothetical protein [Methanomicrobiaceae archaeon]
MEEELCYENYPVRIVFLSNLLTLLIYAAGASLMYMAGFIWAILYILFIAVLEFRLLSRHCVDCYYYGKTCAFGKGRLGAIIFTKGDPKRFIQRKISGKDMIPDLLVIIIPVIAGIALLIFDFNWFIPVLIIILMILGSFGNGFVRGNLACRYCRQRKTGCPALEIFEKKGSHDD